MFTKIVALASASALAVSLPTALYAAPKQLIFFYQARNQTVQPALIAEDMCKHLPTFPNQVNIYHVELQSCYRDILSDIVSSGELVGCSPDTVGDLTLLDQHAVDACITYLKTGQRSF